MPTWGWPHRNFSKMFSIRKTRMMGLPYIEESTVWRYVKPFQYSTAAWQTDGRTHRIPIYQYRSSALMWWCAIKVEKILQLQQRALPLDPSLEYSCRPIHTHTHTQTLTKINYITNVQWCRKAGFRLDKYRRMHLRGKMHKKYTHVIHANNKPTFNTTLTCGKHKLLCLHAATK